MSVVDLLDQAGMFTPGMSISSAAGLAFAIMVEEFKTKGTIPRRLGFEYANMMERFPNRVNTRQKRAIADNMYKNAAQGYRPSLNGMLPPIRDKELPIEQGLSDEELAMLAKQQAELDKRDGLVDSEESR